MTTTARLAKLEAALAPRSSEPPFLVLLETETGERQDGDGCPAPALSLGQFAVVIRERPDGPR